MALGEKNLPQMKSSFKYVAPVAVCYNNTQPYVEKSYTYPVSCFSIVKRPHRLSADPSFLHRTSINGWRELLRFRSLLLQPCQPTLPSRSLSRPVSQQEHPSLARSDISQLRQEVNNLDKAEEIVVRAGAQMSRESSEESWARSSLVHSLVPSLSSLNELRSTLSLQTLFDFSLVRLHHSFYLRSLCPPLASIIYMLHPVRSLPRPFALLHSITISHFAQSLSSTI